MPSIRGYDAHQRVRPITAQSDPDMNMQEHDDVTLPAIGGA
jgi:hypothetical protein